MFSLHHWEYTASRCKRHYNEPLRHTPVNITISKTEQSKKHLKPVFTLAGNPAKFKGPVFNSKSQHFKTHTEEAADSGSRCACTSGAAVQENSKPNHQNTSSKKPKWQNLTPGLSSLLINTCHIFSCISSNPQQQQNPSHCWDRCCSTQATCFQITTLLDFKKF